MAFRVSARTVIELGAELISSDGIAIYELVKNGLDARTRDGVEVWVTVVLGRKAFVDSMSELRTRDPLADPAVDAARILTRVDPSAPQDGRKTFQEAVLACATVAELLHQLPLVYARASRIEVRDTGKGMSAQDLEERYLVLGTPSRKVDMALAEAAVQAVMGVDISDAPAPPYLGEKGVGRLSAMRLGARLHVETATATEPRLNVLDIDWNDFRDPTKMIEDIDIRPAVGPFKASPEWSGTTVSVSDLQSDWSAAGIADVARQEFSRLADPFTFATKRFRLAVFFNGDRVALPRLDETLLKAAHATVRASYTVELTGPVLDVQMLYRSPVTTQTKHMVLGGVELLAITDDKDAGVPNSARETVGPFALEAYWYNRQRLAATDGIGDRTATRELQRRWAGIMVFRDGYRVYPYGTDADDWLNLDRRALGSGGYKLNKAQFVGRVQISRLMNPKLIDQTNREGLRDCPEKRVFVEVLGYVIQRLLKQFMEEVDRQQTAVDLDIGEVETKVIALQKRASDAIRKLKAKHRDSTVELEDIMTMFADVKKAFELAQRLAEQAEDERSRLMHLAGIGLMLEVVAHELARSTETALHTLNRAQGEALPGSLSSTLKTLRSELQNMNKRLRVLDPLSVSARQRNEKFDLVELVRESLNGRSAQFERHAIRSAIIPPSAGRLDVFGVRGMYVQIVENLISNSVYWLSRRRINETGFRPEITISFDSAARELRFSDNGPGIRLELREEIFKPFFSTKDRQHRQGLGLYIARECATHGGGRLELADEHTEHSDRLNTFLLHLPESR